MLIFAAQLKNEKMKRIINVGLAVVMMFVFQQAHAQSFAYVNTQEILQSLPDVKEANANIETFRNQLINLGQKKVETLRAKYTELEQKQAQGDISPKQLELEAQKLKEDEMKIAEFEQESQQRIMEKSEELLKPIRDKVQKAIDDVAKENGYTYVFDASLGFILYAEESTNASAKVKSKLGL
jgi:outer membrane protein